MPIGKGKTKVLNDRIGARQQVTPIARVVDNTSDLEMGALMAHQQFAHISKPDDGKGTRTRRGSLDAGDATKFSGSVVVAPQTTG